MRPRRFDCFPFAGHETEMLLLECRLTELYDAIDWFVIVEADVDHQNHPKPYRFEEQRDRFDQWKDKIAYIRATGLPDTPHAADPWAREHAQREWITPALLELGVDDNDIVFQSDADEIPTVLAARSVNPQRHQLVSLHQRGHFWAVDWLYPLEHGWFGTVAGRWECIRTLADNRQCGPFTAMRDSRNSNQRLPNGGWHFSWIGGTKDEWLRKVGSFCHPEVEQRIRENANRYFRDGIHVDGIAMLPVDVDRTWPRWMQDPANVPTSWHRPR